MSEIAFSVGACRQSWPSHPPPHYNLMFPRVHTIDKAESSSMLIGCLGLSHTNARTHTHTYVQYSQTTACPRHSHQIYSCLRVAMCNCVIVTTVVVKFAIRWYCLKFRFLAVFGVWHVKVWSLWSSPFLISGGNIQKVLL